MLYDKYRQRQIIINHIINMCVRAIARVCVCLCEREKERESIKI